MDVLDGGVLSGDSVPDVLDGGVLSGDSVPDVLDRGVLSGDSVPGVQWPLNLEWTSPVQYLIL
jgi:hypothetical protein